MTHLVKRRSSRSSDDLAAALLGAVHDEVLVSAREVHVAAPVVVEDDKRRVIVTPLAGMPSAPSTAPVAR